MRAGRREGGIRSAAGLLLLLLLVVVAAVVCGARPHRRSELCVTESETDTPQPSLMIGSAKPICALEESIGSTPSIPASSGQPSARRSRRESRVAKTEPAAEFSR